MITEEIHKLQELHNRLIREYKSLDRNKLQMEAKYNYDLDNKRNEIKIIETKIQNLKEIIENE